MSPPLLSIICLTVSAAVVLGQADYTCKSSADCPAWYNASNHQISASSTCVGDPVNTTIGYCGWVGASCSTADDCDYGACHNGVCYGYYGAACDGTGSSVSDCLGTLQCGTDNTCGGEGSPCPNGNSDCTSQNCLSTGLCAAMSSNKMPAGSGCQVGSVCASGVCSSGHVCTAKTQQNTEQFDAAPAGGGGGASPAARHRARRDAHSHGRPRAGYQKRRCAIAGQTACLMGISSGSGLAFECVDTTSSLESCGGCLPVPGSNETQYLDPLAPPGVDCTALQNVEEVVCEDSLCKILACREGSSLNPDGSSCSLTI